MEAKCFTCNIPIVNGRCPECGQKMYGNSLDTKTEGKCQVCNGVRGHAKEIKIGNERGWYCYDCYQEKQRKKYYYREKYFKTKEEAMYYKALQDCYLKPLFYEQEPNYEEIQKCQANRLRAMQK